MEGSSKTFNKGTALSRPFCFLGSALQIFFCTFFCALAYAQTPSPVAPTSEFFLNLKKAAVDSHLASTRQWLLLGHWKKNWTSGYSSEAGDSGLFLSANGAHDPEGELLATLESFARPITPENEKTHGQCRFLARRAWLYQALHIDPAQMPLHPCSAAESWKQKLGADGVSLIFADAYMGNAASMFGHTFLKFHSRENHGDRDLLNYGVNFFASTGSDGGVPFAVFGLIGHYKGYFSLLPYHETLRTYASLEGRDVWEYRLNLTPAELDQLINHLLELQQTYFNYYFLTKNCSYQLLAALEVAKPELHLTDQFWHEVIPADSVRAVSRTPGLVSTIKYRPSLQTRFQESQNSLSGDDLDFVRPLALDKGEAFQKTQEKLAHAPIEKQAQILDSSMMYVDILSAKKKQDYVDRAYKLQILRATTGVRALAEDESAHSSRPPEDGHDSARFGLGLGERNGDGFVDLQTRLAYHNLVSDDTGYLANTQLEVFRFSARQYAWMDRPVFQEFTLLDTISLSPTDRFFQPLAWRADFGALRLADRPESEAPAVSANGGVGYAFYPLDPWIKKLLLFGFLQLHGDAGADIDKGYRVGTSLQAQILYKPVRYFSFNAGYEGRTYYLGDVKNFPSTWLRSSFAPLRNLEFRIDWSKTDQIRESRAIVFWHLMI